ncbi:hypothetical protein FRC00_002492 [Tulasnella sp. 408]|nr:hypothetical protein FRC00_002492 [Tulasnella sp. 408]
MQLLYPRPHHDSDASVLTLKMLSLYSNPAIIKQQPPLVSLQQEEVDTTQCNENVTESQDPQTGFGLDLYDLKALHAKSLVFVHAFVDKLRAAGYQASYKLTVSAATSCTLIRVAAGDPYASLPQNELDRVCCKLREKLSLVQR